MHPSSIAGAFLLLLSALVLLSGYARSAQPPPGQDEMAAMCSMTVPGTQVYAAYTVLEPKRERSANEEGAGP